MNPKLIAFDLDGTLTQHKSPLSDEMRSTLDALRASGRQLLMVGAGACRRIFNQMGAYPIDILGNYGLQYAEYDEAAKDLKFVFDERLPCDRESVLKRASAFREKHRSNTDDSGTGFLHFSVGFCRYLNFIQSDFRRINHVTFDNHFIAHLNSIRKRIITKKIDG